MLEKTLEIPLDCKEIKPVNPKGNQPWIFIERIDAEAETPILWPPDVKSLFTGKDPDAGKDQGQKEKWQQRIRWLDSITNEFEQTLGYNGGQRSLCCIPWGYKELDTTEQLNWTDERLE